MVYVWVSFGKPTPVSATVAETAFLSVTATELQGYEPGIEQPHFRTARGGSAPRFRCALDKTSDNDNHRSQRATKFSNSRCA